MQSSQRAGVPAPQRCAHPLAVKRVITKILIHKMPFFFLLSFFFNSFSS